MLLEFAESTKLYVPIAKIDLVQKVRRRRQGGPGAVEDRLVDLGEAEEAGGRGGRRPGRRAARHPGASAPASPASPIPAEDSHWMAEFEAAFPYEETPDQLTAIEAIKRDMAQPKPMDRLICGDVGYGKTEVAIRAAFKAVDAGKQVGRARADDRPGRAAPPQLLGTDGRVPVRDRGRQPVPAHVPRSAKCSSATARRRASIS